MFAPVDQVIGVPSIANWAAPDLTTAKATLGTIINAVDPYWGGGEFIYLQMPASQAVKVGGVLAYDVATAYLATLMANAAILGKAAAICTVPVASNATAQYAWCQLSGYGPIWSNASIAANTAIGVVAAGQAGAGAAGKQLNNCRVTKPATGSDLTKVCGTTLSTTLQTPNSDGLYVGMLLSGTGIPATTYISTIAVDGKSLVMTNAATASNSVTITFSNAATPDFWNLCVFDRIAMQGPIT
jgi:hypothetical protein